MITDIERYESKVFTKCVLFEKEGYTVHESILDKISNDFLKEIFKTLPGANYDDMIEHIMKNILCPLLSEKTYMVSPTLYDPETFRPAKKVFIGNYSLMFKDIEFITSVKYSSFNYLYLKQVLKETWKTRKLKPKNIRPEFNYRPY